ncbi:hypothetical protein HY642_06935 [Candidatus Woesearchaeota archaeon]|nr:hypothetical protein [Candidatus Woesearchaeota archaeon]
MLVLLLLIAACGKKECKRDADCTAKSEDAYERKCVDYKCEYSPKPGVLGNAKCEADVGENKCTAPEDCGQCTGAAEVTLAGKKAKSAYLENTCNKQNQCVVDLPEAKQKFNTPRNEVAVGGSKLTVETEFPIPFNVKRNHFVLRTSLDSLAQGVSGVTLLRYVLTARTAEGQTITLADKQTSRSLYDIGERAEERLRLLKDYPGNEPENSFTGLQLKGTASYEQVTGTQKQERTAAFTVNYPVKAFPWVRPTITYTCPSVCPGSDSNVRGVCSAQTDYVCEYVPVTGACGNGQCEEGENKCTCSQDCGPCAGKAGKYLSYQCSAAQSCIAAVSPDVVVEQKTGTETRTLGPLQLNNVYTYKSPADIDSVISAQFTLFNTRENVGPLKILFVRLMEAQQQLSRVEVNKELGGIGSQATVQIPLPKIPRPEEDHSLSVSVWYEYTQTLGTEPSTREETTKNSFDYSIGRLTLLNPQ